MEYPKKLIEVALPLDDINIASIKEKNPFLKNHPRSLHLWWARRPLAAARAVLFAQLVNDPGGNRGYGAYKGQTKEIAQKERERLFNIMRQLVKWENTNNKELLESARVEIRKSWEETCKLAGNKQCELPPFIDPFAGGGAIPIESKRLGLITYASDLNPVSVIMNKALLDIPTKFRNVKPTSNASKKQFEVLSEWDGNKGLSQDIRYYGSWLSNKAAKITGGLYEKVDIPKEYGGGSAYVNTYFWAKTIVCPNPACKCIVPVIRSYELSAKENEEYYLKPKLLDNKGVKRIVFNVLKGSPGDQKGNVFRTSVSCNFCNNSIPLSHAREQGEQNKIGFQLIALQIRERGKQFFIDAPEGSEEVALNCVPEDPPSGQIEHLRSCTNCVVYGLKNFENLFLPRQLSVLSTFSNLIQECHQKVKEDAIEAGFKDDKTSLDQGGDGALAYADAISTYISLAISQYTRYFCTLSIWNKTNHNIAHAFGRQALPMTWDFPESNPFNGSLTFETACNWVASSIENLSFESETTVFQSDVVSVNKIGDGYILSTDPPYYNNVPYSNLSDFFYVWLRKSLKNIYPKLFATVLVPKQEELVANHTRHGSVEKAEIFFLNKMTVALSNLHKIIHPAYPMTIYYAFRQSETGEEGTSSSGWETFLEGLIKAGFLISGTWPINTEDATRLRSQKSNALASSIILVCRKRPEDSVAISRKEFLRELKEFLPDALEDMIGGKEGGSPIAPVDLAQAAIGPGMAIFSKYKAVLEADGTPMPVYNALILINQAIDEYFTVAEGEMDADTRFCVDWFQQYGFKEGVFGEADVLARAKGTSVNGIQDAGVIWAKAGKVRLLKITEYPETWNPQSDVRMPIWEACHHMCRALQESESKAGELLSRMPEKAEPIRQLAYRLYTLCERKKWTDNAALYNALITSWRSILEESHKVGHTQTQQDLFTV